MSDWTDLGFPCVSASGYGYSFDLGIVRPGVDSAIPDQKVTWRLPQEIFNVSCVVPPEKLVDLEAFFAVAAYTWFTMPLVSGAGTVDHLVRAVGPYTISYQSPTAWRISFQVELTVEKVPEVPPDGTDYEGPVCCDTVTQVIHTTGLNLAEQAYTGRHEGGKFLFQEGDNVYAFDEDGFDGRVGSVPSPFLKPNSNFCAGEASIGTLRGVHCYISLNPEGHDPVTGCFAWYVGVGPAVIGMNEEARVQLGLSLVASSEAELPLRRIHSTYTVPYSDTDPDCAEFWVIAQHTDGYFCYRFTDGTLPTPYAMVWDDNACAPLNSQHDVSQWNSWSGPGAIEPNGKFLWAVAPSYGRVQLKTLTVAHDPRQITVTLRSDQQIAVTANRIGGAVANGKFALMARNECRVYTRTDCDG